MKNALIVTLSICSLAATSAGIYLAVHSPLFIVRAVEIENHPEQAPVAVETLMELARVPVGRQNLFSLDLAQIEQRILKHEWIRAVTLTKRFPQTVAIGVAFREPRALLQESKGTLRFVDAEGDVFAQWGHHNDQDLPVLSGFEGKDGRQIVDALALIDTWNKSAVGQVSQIASVEWNAERGYRLMVSYAFAAGGRGRTLIDLGQDVESEFEAQLSRLHAVFRHLISQGISARQIYADSDKKIVVRFARGS